MTKERKAIPRVIRDGVLKEYHHSCAICGGKNPHLHHIDENPNNNEPMNLIPLCPNHHLRDQHDPTSPLEAGILVLFRKFKDPTVLSPQFYPLYKRLKVLDTHIANIRDPDVLKQDLKDLIEFVSTLAMGQYYSKKIKEIMKISSWATTTEDILNFRSPQSPQYLFRNEREQIEEMVVELLRYQGWEYKAS